jgi:hypothetical protein
MYERSTCCGAACPDLNLSLDPFFLSLSTFNCRLSTLFSPANLVSIPPHPITRFVDASKRAAVF